MPLSIIVGNLSTILAQTVRIYHFEKLLSTFLQSLSVIITYHLRYTSVPTYNFGKNVKLDSYYPCLSSICGSGHLVCEVKEGTLRQKQFFHDNYKINIFI